MNLDDARKQITAILAELEKDTSGVVESIWVESHDITRRMDTGPVFVRRVHIRLMPKPGAQWADL